MSYLTPTEANALFDEHLAKFPALENDINKIKTLYLTKMWHQIADVLLTYCSNTTFDSSGDGNELIEMYNKLILKMSDRFNPYKYAKLTISCSRQFESIEDSIKFLEEAKVRMRNKRDAIFLLEIA